MEPEHTPHLSTHQRLASHLRSLPHPHMTGLERRRLHQMFAPVRLWYDVTWLSAAAVTALVAGSAFGLIMSATVGYQPVDVFAPDAPIVSHYSLPASPAIPEVHLDNLSHESDGVVSESGALNVDEIPTTPLGASDVVCADAFADGFIPPTIDVLSQRGVRFQTDGTSPDNTP